MFGIWCTRFKTSILGAAEAWAKTNGVRIEFDNKAEAEVEAQRLNDRLLTQNVRYSVRAL